MTAARIEHLAEGVGLWSGDCLAVLPGIDADSFDAGVTDPPYGLSFMGKGWDHGVPDVAHWRAIFRVLKPGAHLLAFGGTRTFGRLWIVIEEAGFEIRDTIFWVYGSGFPKSLDMSKAIDKRPGVERHSEFAGDLRAAMAAKGFTNTFDVAEKVIGRRTGAVANWQKYQWPEARWWPSLRDLLSMDESKWGHVIAEAERERLGGKAATRLAVAPGQENDRRDIELDVTAPATLAARQWSGYGTALKPAVEPIILARKPLSESTVAANVLRWGTGALNIDGCRVAADDQERLAANWDRETVKDMRGGRLIGGVNSGIANTSNGSALGRWPANLIHDGSEEVIAAFPDVTSGSRQAGEYQPQGYYANAIASRPDGMERYMPAYPGSSGSAARFFYSAKADSDDRLGSKHPTVKPVDLMQWLVRLVCPKGRTVLDPFAGTGTTGEAAFREGMCAVLIERENEYCADIRRRMALVMAGPDERAREAIKARNAGKPADHGPLFGAPP